ncbi:metal-dependent hydrolase [Tissierella sp. Yu-01]|uniref:metal-dependent hydrolase n=1 Tax=Tissierella sp. Yu-01 TaxID=3035694 RepID=UPI00240D6B3E|nr:metal-dependent hydrolase [Tissierella sp. Yu-01]WFA08667.1 metal-dependent hydrolase [Tissierella sp. Yu-01]
MKITYLGHSAFILEENNFKAIIDPFISGNSMSNINVDEITGLTHIFVTHGHGDHLGDTIQLAKANDALIITNAEISNYLKAQGLKTHSMHIGGRHKFDFGTVKLTPALHGSAIETGNGTFDGGNPCGFVIKVNNKKVHHLGDTGLTLDMKLLEIEDIDVALVPIGGNFTMDIEDAVRAIDFIKPKLAIPMHYDTFPIIKADPKEFEEKNKTCKTKIMTIGETYEF